MFQKLVEFTEAIVGGVITYISFKPCCDKLKALLQHTLLNNPEHIVTEEENIIIDVTE